MQDAFRVVCLEGRRSVGGRWVVGGWWVVGRAMVKQPPSGPRGRYGGLTNVASTCAGPSRVTRQPPVPVQVPDQPAKTEP